MEMIRRENGMTEKGRRLIMLIHAATAAAGLALALTGRGGAAQTPASAYTWKNVVIRGGGFVSGVVFSESEKGLVYARTDVGGAYRSDDAGEHWKPITDSIGRRDSELTGIESLALDPSDSAKVYLAAGLYTAEWAKPGMILRSSDKGESWQRSAIPAKMGGNEDGRNCGERLAVDPNKGSVLFFGSRAAGLWKSEDSGETWAKVTSFPVQGKLDGPWQKAGISFVAFDRASGKHGEATPSIYVGVAQTGASLYRSDDGGNSWKAVPGTPSNLFPSHAAFNTSGDIYFSFIDNVGPNGITNGEIARYTVRSGKWQNVSPVTPGAAGMGKFGFGGLAIDIQRPQTLMVTTIDHWWPSDLIYRTNDGGKHWKEVHQDAVYSAPQTPWVYWHKEKTGGTGWMSDIAIDPFDSSKVIYTTGEGLWGSADILAADHGKQTHWGFPDDGLEETVPITLISPPVGANLISGVGDIGGFRHDDLTKSPAGGFFDDPIFSNTDKLDFAERTPLLVVRVGRGSDKIIHGAYSIDGGTKWTAFASEPPSSKHGSGSVAVSADGKVVIWTPADGFAFWTADMGKTWNACSGMGKGMNATADRANPNKFYSFDQSTGKFYESFDKGRVFQERQVPVASKGDQYEIAPAPLIDGDIWLIAADQLYHSSDSGVTFTRFENVDKAFSVGFGKHPPGKRYPALYLAGSVDGTEGIFRSDDGGKIWVRINDQEHQFGWIGSVVGDPRVYGRVYVATGGRGIVYGDFASSSPEVVQRKGEN